MKQDKIQHRNKAHGFILKLAFVIFLIITNRVFADDSFDWRTGIIDVTPTDSSGEAWNNAEPSIAVGNATLSGQCVVHAFEDATPSRPDGNLLYKNISLGVPPW